MSRVFFIFFIYLRTDLSAGHGLDELSVNLLCFAAKIACRGGRPKIFTCEPELDIFLAELGLKKGVECGQAALKIVLKVFVSLD